MARPLRINFSGAFYHVTSQGNEQKDVFKSKRERIAEVESVFGIGESGVSQACRRVKDKIRNDKKLGRKIAKIEKKLNVSRMKT